MNNWGKGFLILLFISSIVITIVICNKCNKCNEKFGNMKLIFEDKFNSNKLNTDNWGIFVNSDPTHSCAMYRDPSQISVDNDGLHIKISKSPNNQGFLTGRLYSKKQFQYGYFEANIRINGYSDLMWPAFWLTPEAIQYSNVAPKYGEWPRSGEIDIMESVNNNGIQQSTLHCNNTRCECGSVQDYYCCDTASNGVPVASVSNVDFSQWHKFGCLWEPGKITSYFDDKAVGSVNTNDPRLSACHIGDNTNSPFDIPMNIIFNLAIGGDWAAAVSEHKECKCTLGPGGTCIDYRACNATNCPGLNLNGDMNIQWVKVWQK